MAASTDPQGPQGPKTLTDQERAQLKAQRAERLRRAEDRRVARTERRRDAGKFYRVLGVAGLIFFVVGVALAQLIFR